MKIPLGIAQRLVELSLGIKVPYSKLKHPVISSMLENGIICKQITGRSKTVIYLVSPESLDAYLNNHYAINDLDAYIAFLEKVTVSRAEAVDVAADSKLRAVRTFKGFLVSSLEPLDCIYKESKLTINPQDGTFIFIYDYEVFIPPPHVTVVGIENPEVFRNIKKCKHLFNKSGLIFVCRYPQTKDLVKWLQMIPNNYLHFGDYDYAGINIYYNEYKTHLNDRAKFFVPDELEALIEAKGNRQNFEQQTLLIDPSKINEPAIKNVIELISKYQKGLEQEIFVV